MRHFFSTFHRAVAALLLVAGVASATPIALSTPTGLNVGDKFRFIAITSGVTNPTSSDINTYNTFVQNDFGGATYNGAVVNWKAIGSTATVNARTNVGGFGTEVPVYKPFSGTLVATGLDTQFNPGFGRYGLWSGFLVSAPNESLTGTVGNYIWTGSDNNGTASSSYLGNESVEAGDPVRTNQWLSAASGPSVFNFQFYGLSEELTVGGGAPVPEIDPAGMGSVMALVTGGLGLLERRRLARKRS